MLIEENLILFNINSAGKEAIIKELAKIAFEQNKITSVEEYVDSVMQREKLFTTGVGNGIAIPHGKSNSVKEAMIIFAKLQNGVDWDSLDGKPVDMVFLLGVPDKDASDLHLKILSQLSRKLVNEEFVERLRGANSKGEILELLGEIKVN